MLEVCFNPSVKGSLAFAQRCKKNRIGGAIGIITDKTCIFSFFTKRKALKEYRKRQLQLQQNAISLGGTKEDIAGISFGLSEGDIQSVICLEECPRKAHIRSGFCFEKHNEEENREASLNDFWTACVKDLQKLQSNPPKIRIWLDSTPDAQCGLLFVADLLKESKTEIHVVELPKKIIREDGCIVEYRGWGEVEPQLYGTYLDKEKVLSQKEVLTLAKRWEMLKSQNAPLRVVENSRVNSADISYYDDCIRKEFSEKPLKIAFIIGRVLAKQKNLTSDVFIAKRIQCFIDSGELAVRGKTENGFYSATVSCTK